MNEIEETVVQQPAVTIAACVFVKYDDRTHRFKLEDNIKPYFYLNVIGATVGDHALVHSDKFGVVHIARVIPTTDAVALGRIAKPLLAQVNYDHVKMAEAAKLLNEFRDASELQRLDQAIDLALGRAVTETSPTGDEIIRPIGSRVTARKKSGYKVFGDDHDWKD